MKTLDRKRFFINLMEQFNLEPDQLADDLQVDASVVQNWIDFTCCDSAPTREQLLKIQKGEALKPISDYVFSETKAVIELENIKDEMAKRGETGWLSRISNVINLLT